METKIAKIQAPDGKILRLEVPVNATPQEIEAFAAQSYDMSALPSELPAPNQRQISQYEMQPSLAAARAEGAKNALMEATNALTLGLQTPAAAGIASLATGKPFSQTYAEAQRSLQQTRQEMPGVSTTAGLAGALLTPGVGTLQSAAAGTGKGFLGALRNIFAGGAVAGGQSGLQTLAETGDLKSAGQSAGIGAAMAGGLGLAGQAARGIYNIPFGRTPQQQAMAAEQIALGRPLTAGQTGSAGIASTERLASQASMTGAPLRQAYESQGDVIGQGLQDIGQSLSGGGIQAATREEAGKSITAGLERAFEKLKQRNSKQYEAVFNMLPPDTKFIPSNTQQAISEFAAKFGDNEAAFNLAGGKEIRQIAQALNKPISLNVVKTTIKQTINDKAEAFAAKGQTTLARDLYSLAKAVDDDIVATVENARPGLGARLKKADEYMTKRLQDNEALRKLFNSADPDKIKASEAYTRAVNMAMDKTADVNTLSVLRKRLPPQEWGTFRQFFVENLGREMPGQAGFEAGFSPRKFLTDYNKLDKNAKNILFSAEQRQALESLAKYADVISTTTPNASGTAANMAQMQTLGLVGAGAAGGLIMGDGSFTDAMKGAAIGIGLPYAISRAAASPKFARMVNKLPPDILMRPRSERSRIFNAAIRQFALGEEDVQTINMINSEIDKAEAQK